MQVSNLDFLSEQFDGDEECISEILNIFIESSDETICVLNSSIENRNKDNLLSASHKLKGSTGTIGGELLSAQCFVVDKLCKDQDFDKAFEEASVISKLYDELKDAIAKRQ
jgi:HPt (histidine-containing phosphotransfer) domain-containing protein